METLVVVVVVEKVLGAVEPVVSLGDIVTLVVTVMSVLSGAGVVLMRLSKMDMKLSLLWNWYRRQHNIDSAGDSRLEQFMTRGEIEHLADELRELTVHSVSELKENLLNALKEHRSYVHNSIHATQTGMQLLANRQHIIWASMGKPTDQMPRLGRDAFKPEEQQKKNDDI
jgi:hypothetical protein